MDTKYLKFVPCCNTTVHYDFQIPEIDFNTPRLYRYDGSTIYEGVLIPDQCYYVTKETGTPEYISSLPEITTIAEYLNPFLPTSTCNNGKCLECPPCYILYNCSDSTVLYTYTDLDAFLGTFVTLFDYDQCWYVAIYDGDVPDPVVVDVNSEVPCSCALNCYVIAGNPTSVTYVSFFNVLETVSGEGTYCSKIVPHVSGGEGVVENLGPCVNRVCPTKCYELTNCDTEEVIYSVNQDLIYPYTLDQIVKLAEFEGCWTIQFSELCDAPVNTTVIETYANCETCSPPVYYRLDSCNNSEPLTLFTSQDISAYVGRVVTLDEYPGCFIVTVFETSFPSPVTITITNSYADCPECAAQRYKLTDCDGLVNPLYTTTDLSAYVGSVIKLKFCPETCWTVEETQINTSDDLVIVDSQYESCIICTTNTVCFCSTVTNNSVTDQTFQFRDCDNQLQSIILNPGETSRKHCVLKWIFPEGWILPKVITNHGDCVDGKCPLDVPFKTVRPGYNSPACSTEYYERIVCAYSEVLYRDVIAQRYGIAPCCLEDELYRLDIKYQLLELQAILNPDYICTPVSSCCQETDTCNCGCNS